MEPFQVDLITRSWRTVVPVAGPAMDLFYEEVFTRAPEARGLFKDDMSEQKNKLAQTLGFAVAGLQNPGKLIPALKALGKSHASLGIQPAHYDVVGEALLATLERLHGELWVDELREAWTAVYGVVATTMMEAATERAA